jgi:hypothetical protein
MYGRINRKKLTPALRMENLRAVCHPRSKKDDGNQCKNRPKQTHQEEKKTGVVLQPDFGIGDGLFNELLDFFTEIDDDTDHRKDQYREKKRR